MAYNLKNLTDNFFQLFCITTSWVALSIKNIKTRASTETTSRIFLFLFFNGGNVAKHWNVAGRGICHLWLPCYLAPGGGCEVLFSPCLSVCVCVCVSGQYFGILFLRLLERDIDLKFIQGAYRVVLNLLKNIDLHRVKVKVTGTVHWFLKVQSYHKNWAIEKFQYFFYRHLLGYSIRWKNKNLSE